MERAVVDGARAEGRPGLLAAGERPGIPPAWVPNSGSRTEGTLSAVEAPLCCSQSVPSCPRPGHPASPSLRV